MSQQTRKKPELLLPAGTLAHQRYAYAFGADAVYAGQPRYSLRARNNTFGLEQLASGIERARNAGKKLYIASNVIPHNSKIKTYIKDMEPIIALSPDALIMADPGLIMMVKERWPNVEVHLSVQANATNYAAVKFWYKAGISRVILSRELSLDEIAEIKQQCPEMELEVFVHGSLCIAYSGRCLLSGYFNHRDPNQGTCTNACRWDYKVHETTNNENGDAILPQHTSLSHVNNSDDTAYLLEDVSRPGEFMPISEDENGTYILNSKDLRAVQHINKLIDIGVDSFKVEGRTKSIYYVARVAQTYRKAIDDAWNGREFDPALLASLEGLANRGYTDGFFQRHTPQEQQNYIDSHSKSRLSQYVGDVVSVDNDGYGLIEVKNKFAIGDTIDIIHPSGNKTITITTMFAKTVNEPVEVAQGSGIWVRLPEMHGYNEALLARIIPQ
jgi:U32 family peptidase